MLQHMYQAERARAAEQTQVLGRQTECRIWSNKEFMTEFADHQKTRTQSGFNPLLEEYENMFIFTASANDL